MNFFVGRLYFVTLNTDASPKSTASAHYFAVDTEQFYDSFYNDFGPLNLAILFHYCGKLDRKLSNSSMQNKKIVHYTGTSDKNRVNAAYLIGAYAVRDFKTTANITVIDLGHKTCLRSGCSL